MSYRRSPTLSAVLRDLSILEQHGRCDVFIWRWREGVFTCSSCRVRRTADPLGDYTSTVGVSDKSDIVSRGPVVLLTPDRRGHSRPHGSKT
jgi:hypothetical protein